jgi:hypothetical protein
MKIEETREIEEMNKAAAKARLKRLDTEMTTRNTALKTKLNTFRGAHDTALKAERARILALEEALHKEQARRTVQVEQVRERAARLMTENLEHDLANKRGLAAHQVGKTP